MDKPWLHFVYHYELNKVSSVKCPLISCKFKSKCASYFAFLCFHSMLTCLITPVPSVVLDPSVNQMSPLTTGGVLGPLIYSSLVNIVTLYLGSRL